MAQNVVDSAAVGDREAIRNSGSRRYDLEFSSRRRTGEWDLSLSIDKEHRTAHVAYNPQTGKYKIVISGREFEQPVTEYDPIVWDKLAQAVLTLHENAHVLYTDFDDVSERVEDRPSKYAGVYHQIHNAFEDGRIETLIRIPYKKFSTQLLHFRANLMYEGVVETGVENVTDAPEQSTTDESVDVGPQLPDDNQCAAPASDDTRCGRTVLSGITCWQHDDADAQSWSEDTWCPPNENTKEVISLFKAVIMGALDRTTYNSGAYDSLLDGTCDTYRFASPEDRKTFVQEIAPRLEETAKNVVEESNAKKANAIIFAFVDQIIDYIDNADNSGTDEANENVEQGEGPGGMPSDAGRESKPVEPNGPTMPSQEGEESDDEGDDEKTESVSTDKELEEEIKESIEQEKDLSEDDDEDPFEEAVDGAKSSGGFNQTDVQDVPKTGPVQYWDTATYNAEYIKQHITLSEDKAFEVTRNQDWGAVDGSALVRAVVGDSRNYKQNISEPDTPEFNLAIVLDRSGSMKGSRRRTGIIAVASLALALKSYPHVNVMILELYEKQVRRVMPLGSDPEEYKSAITHDARGGGTPLSSALALAVERLKLEGSVNVNNRIFVVTDGKPDDRSTYNTQLRNSPFPVVGLSITDSHNAAGEGFYHRHETVSTYGDSLVTTLGTLANELTTHAQH